MARMIDASDPGKAARVAPPTARARIEPLPLGWLVTAAAIGCVAVCALLASADLALQVGARPLDLACAGAGMAVLLLYLLRDAVDGWRRALHETVTHAALFTLFCLTGAVAAYPVAAGGGGYVDAALVRADAMLGFHWPVWYVFVASHHWAQTLGRAAYLSIFVTPALLIGQFARTRRTAEARRFLAAFWTAAVLTLAIARALPVRGPLASMTAARLPYVPVSGLFQAELPPRLRLHELHQVDLMALHGLVGAPSFHTASAVLYVAVGWRCRRLRWPILALNSAMLLATPVEGTHYLVDMLMGAGVALVALALVDAVIRWRVPARARWRSAAPGPSMP
ncbi:phosphatase PAP2 family protein [Sphingomonas sp.]|uniref:phosphatase PAP2 family protein n=1 Tax=Sphingomonas sp. TaxID=28214 RepID=UPI003B00642D